MLRVPCFEFPGCFLPRGDELGPLAFKLRALGSDLLGGFALGLGDHGPGFVQARGFDALLLMARKLMRFTTLLAVPAVGLGLWLWLGIGIGQGPGSGWMHAKLFVVLLVLGYHHACGALLRKLRRLDLGVNRRRNRWWQAEIPGPIQALDLDP